MGITDTVFGTPGATTIHQTPGTRDPGYNFARDFFNSLLGISRQPYPTYQGQLDPGLSPSMQVALRRAQGYGESGPPEILAGVQGSLGRFMNPSFINPAARIPMGTPNYSGIDQNQRVFGGQTAGQMGNAFGVSGMPGPNFTPKPFGGSNTGTFGGPSPTPTMPGAGSMAKGGMMPPGSPGDPNTYYRDPQGNIIGGTQIGWNRMPGQPGTSMTKPWQPPQGWNPGTGHTMEDGQVWNPATQTWGQPGGIGISTEDAIPPAFGGPLTPISGGGLMGGNLPAWQQLANMGLGGQGSAAANRAALATMGAPSGGMDGGGSYGGYSAQQLLSDPNLLARLGAHARSRWDGSQAMPGLVGAHPWGGGAQPPIPSTWMYK